jgi:hypothetical protein
MKYKAAGKVGAGGIAIMEAIQNRIFTIRGVQVMLDSDLADLYGVEVRVLNQQVRRNADRFPEEFMFQLTPQESNSLRSQNVTLDADGSLSSQNVTLKKGRGQHRKYLPHAFTEQGVAMLSTVLRSETAVRTSIQIINAFVAMRRFLLTNAQIFQRLDTLEWKQLETDMNVGKILTAIESKEIRIKQGIFFQGQVFDAYIFVSDIFKSAEESIIVIDNYLDDSVLTLLTKRKKNVNVLLLTKNMTNALVQDVKKCNEQYPSIEIKEFRNAHDRFIILDNSTVYHFGASLKDMGKKLFAFSKMEIGAAEMLARLGTEHGE